MICVLAGSPSAESSSCALGVSIADTLAEQNSETVEVIELCRDDRWWSLSSRSISRVATETIARSSVLVVTSPTYYGTYSGLLKMALDGLDQGAAADKIAVPVMTGSSILHARSAELFLRPMLAEMGCLVPFSSCFGLAPFEAGPDAVAAAWVEENDLALKKWGFCADMDERVESTC